jgi:MFS family permease
MSVAKWTLRKRMVLWCKLSMVGSYLSAGTVTWVCVCVCVQFVLYKRKKKRKGTWFEWLWVRIVLSVIVHGKLQHQRTYVSANVPLTNALVRELFPTARKPRIATLRWTSWGSLFFILSCCDTILCILYNRTADNKIEVYYSTKLRDGQQLVVANRDRCNIKVKSKLAI